MNKEVKNIIGVSGKAKDKLNKFDGRGVQTLFRTLSRNHYNLLRMVDNKASIILTVNSIIISLLMGVIYMAPDAQKDVLQLGSKILLNFGMASMVFALFAMLPHKYYKLGKKYSGILYAQNFSKLSLEEYTAEMTRVISTGNMTYTEMINDLYFLGKSVSIKQRLITLSVVLFLVGLVSAIVLTLSHGIMIEKIFFK